jgi:hypothetical protein
VSAYATVRVTCIAVLTGAREIGHGEGRGRPLRDDHPAKKPRDADALPTRPGCGQRGRERAGVRPLDTRDAGTGVDGPLEFDSGQWVEFTVYVAPLCLAGDGPWTDTVGFGTAWK